MIMLRENGLIKVKYCKGRSDKLKVICAWCRKVIRQDVTSSHDVICTKCNAEIEKEFQEAAKYNKANMAAKLRKK